MAKKITHIDVIALREVRDEVNAHLASLGKKLGLSFKATKGLHGGAIGSLTIEFAVGEGVNPVDMELAETWRRSARSLGFDPDLLGREFKSPVGTYRLRGCYPGRSKNPIALTVVGGPEDGVNKRASTDYMHQLVGLNKPVVVAKPNGAGKSPASLIERKVNKGPVYGVDYPAAKYKTVKRGVGAGVHCTVPLTFNGKPIGVLYDTPQEIVAKVEFSKPEHRMAFLACAKAGGFKHREAEYNISEFARKLLADAEKIATGRTA